MTTLFQITLAYDDLNQRYCAAAFDIHASEATSCADSLNKVWTEMGKRIKTREKARQNSVSKNGTEPSRIIAPGYPAL